MFTKNATEAINLVAYSWGRANVGPDDLVVITQMEHHSNIVPWQLLGCRLAYIPVADDGPLDLDAFDALLEQGPKLVAVAHVSNVVGHDQPDRRDRRAGARGRRAGAGRRRAGRAVDCRSTSPSSTPTSTPGPATRPTGRRASASCTAAASCCEAMPPFLGGGHMIARVGDFESTWAEPPASFEAGTMPVAEAIGLGAAVDWLTGIGMDAVREHGRDVTAYALERLCEVPGLTVHGTPDADARGSLVELRPRRRAPA